MIWIRGIHGLLDWDLDSWDSWIIGLGKMIRELGIEKI
jgi:hypothetical protein